MLAVMHALIASLSDSLFLPQSFCARVSQRRFPGSIEHLATRGTLRSASPPPPLTAI